MNNKLANLFKGYIEDLTWIDKISGLVQTANIRIKNGDTITDKSYPVSCSIDYDACIKGGYQDLAPNSKKKSVLYFEDKGITNVERIGNRLKLHSSLRLVCWLNLKEINQGACDDDSGPCGVSGDYIIEIIKALPSAPFATADFISIYINSISQVERSVDIFSKYTYNEEATQYLMYPYDYFALDLEIDFTIPCIEQVSAPQIITILPPTAFALTVFSDTQIDLAWTNNIAGDAVSIERSLNGNDFAEIHRTIPGDVAYSDKGLIAGTRYYYRARAFSGINYSAYTNVEDAGVVPYTMLLTSTGTGAGVSTLRMYVWANITVTLGANAKFYTDAAGTLNPSSIWTITAGAVRTIYLKCTTGTALMTFSDISKVIRWGGSVDDHGWISGTNAASITAVLPSIVNLTEVKINGNAYLSGAMPVGVTYLSLWPLVTWSYNGNLPTGVTFLYFNGVNINWTGLDFTGSSNITYFTLNNYRIAKMSSADMITLLTSLTNRVGALPATIYVNDYADYVSPPAGVTNAVATLKAAKNITTVNLGQ